MAKSKGRDASLEQTLDSLTKRFGEGTIMRLGEAHRWLDSTSFPPAR